MRQQLDGVRSGVDAPQITPLDELQARDARADGYQAVIAAMTDRSVMRAQDEAHGGAPRARRHGRPPAERTTSRSCNRREGRCAGLS